MGKIDATLRQPQLSSNIIAFLTAICVVLLGVWTGVLDIDSYDLMLSLPVMESFRTPELFSRQDLLIESGRVIPFYVYRALSYFSSFGIRIEDLITYGFIVTHAAALYVFWWISLYFVQSRVVASLSAIIIGISIPDSLCFNWTYFPTRCFVSASAALPFLCLSILFILRERFWLASLAATVTALAHPGLGMISLALVSAGIVGTKQASFSTKGVRLLGVGAGALILLFAVGSHVAQNKSDLVDSKLVWKIFTVFSEHSLIEFHWPDRYIEYLLANTTLFIVLLYMPEIPRRKATSLLLCSYILIGVYGLNLYLLGDFTLVQTFLFRASLITKLLGIPILLWGFIHFWTREHEKIRIVMVVGSLLILLSLCCGPRDSQLFWLVSISLLIASILLSAQPKNHFSAYPLSLIVIVIIYYASIEKVLGSPIIWATVCGTFSLSTFFIYIHLRKHRVYSSSTHGEGLYAKLTLTLLVLFIAGEECATTGAVFIVSTIDSVAPGTIISLSSWCQRFSPSGSLFLVDPTDPRFLFFRYLAKRSLFISVPDINQLSYDLKAYQEGFLRLQELNVTAHREPFSGQAMPTLQVPYRDISEEQVLTLNRKYGITHVITSLNARQLRFNRVYQNEDFVVYSLEGENASESYRETGQV